MADIPLFSFPIQMVKIEHTGVINSASYTDSTYFLLLNKVA